MELKFLTVERLTCLSFIDLSLLLWMLPWQMSIGSISSVLKLDCGMKFSIGIFSKNEVGYLWYLFMLCLCLRIQAFLIWLVFINGEESICTSHRLLVNVSSLWHCGFHIPLIFFDGKVFIYFLLSFYCLFRRILTCLVESGSCLPKVKPWSMWILN